jgi:hypothetical protein
MSASDSGAVSPVPEHLRTVTSRLVVSDGAAAIAFYGAAAGIIALVIPTIVALLTGVAVVVITLLLTSAD